VRGELDGGNGDLACAHGGRPPSLESIGESR
jgi:hypothetical protein